MSQSKIIFIAKTMFMFFICCSAMGADKPKDEKSQKENLKLGPISLSGYVQPRYRSDDATADAYDIRRARLDLNADLAKTLKVRLQSELGGSSQRLLDAYFAYNWKPFLRIQGGQFKIPFSQENLTSSSKLETINRSQIVEALVARSRDVLGNQNGRDIGFQISGSGYEDVITYAVAGVNGAGINTGENNEQKDFVGRLVVRPVKPLFVGINYYEGRNATLNRDRVGVELAFLLGAFSSRAEYIQGEDGTTEKNGWYAQLSYFALPKQLQAVVKFDTFDPDRDTVKNGSDVITIGANYFFYPSSFIQVNYEIKREEGESIGNNQLAAQFTFIF